jgi:hypothetical protein
MFVSLPVHNYHNLFLYYHIIDTEEMSQRTIKQRVDKQIQLYRKQDTILETATIFDGTISSILINPGSYSSLTVMSITITDPPTKATPDTGTSTVSLTGTSKTRSFSITTSGSGYTTTPIISFSGGGGGGNGVVTTVVLTTGTVTSITLVSGGSGYTSAPDVSFSGGGGTGPVVTCALTGTSISSVSVSNPGWYYTTVPLVSITGGAGPGNLTSTFTDEEMTPSYT